MLRTEINIATGESRQIVATPYIVDGVWTMIDDGQPVPAGAVLASTIPVSDAVDVPQVVTRRQALLALLAAGKLDQIESLIQGAPRAVQIAWEAAGTFERTNPLIESLAPEVGLAEPDLDALFVQAAQL